MTLLHNAAEKIHFSRKPRILWANFYCLLDTSSGASISVREILCQLVKEGFDVNIIGAMTFDSEKGVTTLQKHLEVIDESECINIDDAPLLHKLIVTKSRFRQEMTAKEENDWYWLYIKTLEEFKPDLVFFYGGQPLDFLISLEARQRGIPSAAYLVNANYRGTRWCRDIDLFITDSSATSNFYATNFGITPIPCGKFIDSSKVIAKKKTRKNILFINPSLQKGVGIVIQLAILLEKRRPDITFEVVESRGDWHLLLKEISGNLGESRESLANVIVTPNTNDMRPVYGRAKLLLAPSLWWESGARVLAEAMLNGIPAIVTDYGGSPEMVGNAGVKIKLPEECHEKPFDRLPKVELLEPLIQMIERFYDDQDFYNNYVERATHVGQTVHNIKVSTQRVVQAFAPYIKRYAGDFDQATLLKYTHKHHLQESVNIKSTVAHVVKKSHVDADKFLFDVLSGTSHVQPAGIIWLIQKELQYGGFHSGIIRNKTSPLDTRKPQEYSAGFIEKNGQFLPTHIGGDRMSFTRHGYSLAYASYLMPFIAKHRNKKLTIIEIGILKGIGLAIWCDLFPDARVIGLDLDTSNFLNYKNELKNKGAFTVNEPEVYDFDQFENNSQYLLKILKEDKVDIVIDDGAHTFEAITNTFNSIESFLADEYLYFIEDFKGIENYLKERLANAQVVSQGFMTVIAPEGYPQILESPNEFLSSFSST